MLTSAHQGALLNKPAVSCQLPSLSFEFWSVLASHFYVIHRNDLNGSKKGHQHLSDCAASY